MLSATRVAMGCALMGRVGTEHAVYARAYVLGLVALGLLSVAPIFL